MVRGRRRKCKCCRRIFRPDPGNRRHQRYCSASRCRRASKAASQARWLARAENHDYFRGPVHLARCQAWRARHPGNWRKGSRVSNDNIAQLIQPGTFQDQLTDTRSAGLRGRDESGKLKLKM
jgi:hypothetical protein